MERDMLSEIKDAFKPYFSLLEIQIHTVQRMWRIQVDLFNGCMTAGTRQMDRIWQDRDPVGLLGVPVSLSHEISEKCGAAVIHQWDSIIDANKTLSGLNPLPPQHLS